MKEILFYLCCCLSLLAEAGEYGKIIPLRRIPGVDEGAMATALFKDSYFCDEFRGSWF